MKVTIKERDEFKAVVLKAKMGGQDVRRAWKEMQSKDFKWINHELGYVFIPEWQWSTGVKDLWVGVEVNSFTQEHEEFEQFSLPKRKYATIKVKGDRKQLDQTYLYLDEWFKESEYERDYSQGSYGFEANQLNPINPFDIPADEINYFDFEIYAPIK